MVDMGVLDRVPDVLETSNFKHDTSRASSTYRMCVKDILSCAVMYCTKDVIRNKRCQKCKGTKEAKGSRV